MLQNALGQSVANKIKEDLGKLQEHTARIKAKIESGNAIDKSIIDREAIKELNQRDAHSKAKVVKAIEHKVITPKEGDRVGLYSTIIVDIPIVTMQDLEDVRSCVANPAHVYIICSIESIRQLRLLLQFPHEAFELIHTFKYSSALHKPKIGFKCHYEFIVYLNIGNKPVNHLLPNVIESTYEKDSRNLGFYTNLLLRSANAGDTILGINITNGNLIKAAQAMLCSTITIPVNEAATRDCEKTIKELQFK